jgi:hypothetical protein
VQSPPRLNLFVEKLLSLRPRNLKRKSCRVPLALACCHARESTNVYRECPSRVLIPETTRPAQTCDWYAEAPYSDPSVCVQSQPGHAALPTSALRLAPELNSRIAEVAFPEC